jgi:hypothetical protein
MGKNVQKSKNTNHLRVRGSAPHNRNNNNRYLGISKVANSTSESGLYIEARGGEANYKAGYRAERFAIEFLQKQGYLAFRTAGSHGVFDVIGFNAKEFVLLQLKVCKYGKLSSYELVKDGIRKTEVPSNARKELWVWERRRGFHYFPL